MAEIEFAKICAHLADIERSCAYLKLVLDPPDQALQRDELLRTCLPYLGRSIYGLGEACEQSALPLSRPTVNQLTRVKAQLAPMGAQPRVVTDDDFRHLEEQMRALRTAVLDDLTEHRFYFVPAFNKELMDSSREHFGSDVSERFSSAAQDISEAAQCLALHLGTACVFHLMRALEHGLRELARSLSVQMAKTVDLENWKNIIDQIESTIRKERAELSQEAKSHTRNEELQRLSEIALQLGYFKDAWRNHVSHAGVRYGPDEARSVWNHVKDFMQKMAGVV